MLQMAQRKRTSRAAQSCATNPAVIRTVSGSDYGTDELAKRHSVTVEGDPSGRGTDTHHARVVDQTVIDKLFLSGRLDSRKYQAALRLLDSFHRGGMSPILVINFARECIGTGRAEWTDNQITAREATNAALKAISPLNDVVWDVVLHDRTLTEVEISRRWPKSTAFVVLDLGLEALARHYGIEP